MAKDEIILCNTNILIELSKNNADIKSELKRIGLHRIAVSAVSAGEFIFGALNKSDLIKIKKALSAIEIIQVNEPISENSLALIEEYGLSHSLTVPDSLIAATALFYSIPLFTLNLKDFRCIPGITLHNPSFQS